MKTTHLAPHAAAGLTLILAALQSTLVAFAADKTWVGGSGDWHDPAQWDPAGVPAAGDTAIFPFGGTCAVTQAVTIAGLTLTNTTINNTAPVVVTNLLFHSGVLTGGGLFTVAAGGTLTLPDQYAGVSGKILRLEGNTVAQGTQAGLSLFPDAAVENLGVLDLQDDSDRWLSWGGEGSGNYLLNQGTLRKSGGTGSTVFQVGIVVTNAGTVEALSGTIRFSDRFIQTAGETILNGGDLKFDRRSALLGGVLRGSGAVLGPLTNAATVSPGASAGALHILRNPFVLPGDYTQTAAGALHIELGGPTATNQYDVLNVEDEAALAGALNVSLINGFSPARGNSFTILTCGSRNGEFDSFNPPQPNRYTWGLAYTDNAVTLFVSNSAPVLPVQTNRTIPELTTLTVTNTATDADLPADTLTYQLLNPPAGAAISSAGVITWTPTEAQGPMTTNLVTVVTDNGTPPLSTTNVFQVTVLEVNQAPLPNPIANTTRHALDTVTLTATATDGDIPANTLTWSLVSGPAGAGIQSGTGQFTWAIPAGSAGTTNPVTLRVVDNGSPPLSNSVTFQIVVVNPLQVLSIQPAAPNQFNVTWNSVSNHVYALESRTNVSAGAWSQVGGNVTATNVTTTRNDAAATNTAKFYRVRQVTP